MMMGALRVDDGRGEGAKPTQARAGRARAEIRVASSVEDMMKVVAIRAAVFLSEQNCPYGEEFDGNDFAATHLLACQGEEPIGTLRLRFFADFVKPERLAVLKRYRTSTCALDLVRTGLELARRKGYRTAYGHAQKRLVSFWSRFGFRPMTKNYELVFSDHEYVEMKADLDPHPDPLTINSPPLVLIRPEGSWDIAGPLDQSASRPATNPIGG